MRYDKNKSVSTLGIALALASSVVTAAEIEVTITNNAPITGACQHHLKTDPLNDKTTT